MSCLFFNNILITIFLMSGNTHSIESEHNNIQLKSDNLNHVNSQKRRNFDPNDSMKYMIGGINNQYSKDYNFGTSSFNPNKFAYMFSGNMVSDNGRSFIPSYSNSRMFENSPNNQKTNSDVAKSTKSPTNIQTGLPVNNDKKQSFGNVDVITPTLSSPYVVPSNPLILEPDIMPPLMIEQIPEGTLSNINVTNMFLKSPYRGQPGMLGYGAQISVPHPRTDTTKYTSMKQEHVPELALSQYTAAVGRDQNTDSGSEFRTTYNHNSDSLKQDLSIYENIKPLDNFVVLNPFDNMRHHEINDNDTSVGNQNSPQNTFQVIKPITTGYDWQGEWPGHSDSTENKGWSDGWSKNWEHENPENENRVLKPMAPSDNDTDIANRAESQEKGNKDRIDGMQSALDVFQEFLSFLRNTNLPIGSGQKESTNNDFDYNQMAKSWAKDVHA